MEQRVHQLRQFGIEDLWIIREDDSPSEDTRTGNNIHFRDAENFW